MDNVEVKVDTYFWSEWSDQHIEEAIGSLMAMRESPGYRVLMLDAKDRRDRVLLSLPHIQAIDDLRHDQGVAKCCEWTMSSATNLIDAMSAELKTREAKRKKDDQAKAAKPKRELNAAGL